jgi:hypothetical protein
MKELMVFKDQMFEHLTQEWFDVLVRAAGVWTPRWRGPAAAPAAAGGAAPAAGGAAGGAAAGGATSVGGSAPAALTASAGKETTNRIAGSSSNTVSAPAPTPAPTTEPSSPTEDENNLEGGGSDDNGDSGGVLVAEDILTQLWLPGRIVHIYIRNGQCHGAEVSRSFPELRTIALQGNIFEDHRSDKIQSALLELRAVRHANQLRTPPTWQAFNASDICSCCHNSFTWNSTFSGQAQEFRDKYNCRNCGRLVCDPCSTQRRAIPKFGHIFPKRICDQCLYKGDFAFT